MAGPLDSLMQYAPKTPAQAQADASPTPQVQMQAPAAQSLPKGNQAQAPQGQQAQAPQPQGGPMDSLMQYAPPPGEAQAQPQMPMGATGDISGNDASGAIPHSPLGIMQRAMLGWVRTPQEQLKYLKQNFDDASAVPNGDGGVSLAVKTKGKWFQADPAMHWGSVGDMADQATGALAQGAGEYGLRAAGAAQGAAYGAGVGTTLAGPIGTAIGLAAGAYAGSAGAEAADLGSRAALMDPNAPGAEPYRADELLKQLNASGLFGIEAEAGSKAIGLTVGGAAKALGGAIKYATNIAPDGASAVKSMLTKFGVPDLLAQARLANPMANAATDALAQRGATGSILGEGPSSVAKGQFKDLGENIAGNIQGDMKAALGKQAGQFNALTKGAGDTQFDFSSPISNAKQQLQDGNFITPRGQINEARVLSDVDKQALKFILDKAPTSNGMSYGEARAVVSNDMGNLIDGTGGNLRRILIQTKNDMHQAIMDGFSADGKDEMAQLYGKTLNQYSTVSDIAEELKQAVPGGRGPTLIKKLLSGTPNQAQATVADLIDNGIDQGNITKLLQWEGSRQAAEAGWLGNGRITQFIPGAGPRTGIGMASRYAQAIQSTTDSQAGQFASKAVPYAAHAMKWIKSLDTATRQQILTNPQALQAMDNVITSSVVGEQQKTGSLLQGAGVTGTQ